MELFTNSMLRDWKTCKCKYYFKYIKKVEIPKREENFELGRKVHALISYYLDGHDMSIMENAAGEEVLVHYRSILSHPLLKKEHFLSEWGFNVVIGDTKNVFVGRIDAVFHDKNKNKYIIADWKTGMKIPDAAVGDIQAQVYLYSFYRAQSDLGINFEPEDLSFIFVQTPSLNESRVDFSKELYEKFEADFIKTIAEIQKCKQKPESVQNSACKFCEYRFMCKVCDN
ncbi:MAG: PD-(D/E)XK nuclease family protein [bacterium]|nr:PD-(D/E)XK nuclease family protein [bacterium]